MPRRHRLLERFSLAFQVRHEVMQAERLDALLAVCVGVDRGELGNGALYLLALVQSAVLPSVRRPLADFRVAEALPCFFDGTAADAVEDELVEEFGFGVELVRFFPRPVTSPMTRNSSMVRLPLRAPRSGSASPVMSATVNTGLPSASQMHAAMRPATASLPLRAEAISLTAVW